MGKKLLIGTRKGLFTVQPNGSGWGVTDVAFLGDNIPMALADPRDGAIYAAIEHGHFGMKLQRSDDGGATWDEIGVPAYPAPDKLAKVWALEPGHADQPGVLWCGTIPGGLFRSGDHGRTWTLVESLWNHPGRLAWLGGGADLPGIHSVCVDPRDSGRITLGVSCGGVWVSTDGGETWNCRADGMFAAYMPPERRDDPTIQDPHRVVQCRDYPENLWAQHHNGVFRSTDGSSSWREVPDVPPSTFGFAVAVHPSDPETAWFVPGKSDQHRIPVDGRLVVTRTRDGGASFDVLTTGLPQQNAYDIAYRHALDVDDRGQSLAFGSTTGGLWVSDDQGDTWQAVAEHLPPVYCVRFAAA
jgi:photosystem II stability/assembly factor-like uncharacterized protein